MIRIVRMTFWENKVSDFIQLFEERKMDIRNFNGCNHLELWRDEKEAHIFYTYSIWKGPENLEAYIQSELFADTWSRVKIWFKEKPMAFSTFKEIVLP